MAARVAKQPTDRITVRLPKAQIHQIDALVQAGVYRNTTDLVYNAVKELLLAKGTEAKATIESQKGLLAIQEELAAIDAKLKKLGLK